MFALINILARLVLPERNPIARHDDTLLCSFSPGFFCDRMGWRHPIINNRQYPQTVRINKQPRCLYAFCHKFWRLRDNPRRPADLWLSRSWNEHVNGEHLFPIEHVWSVINLGLSGSGSLSLELLRNRLLSHFGVSYSLSCGDSDLWYSLG